MTRLLTTVSESLLSHPQFRRIWLAHTVSQFGSQITLLALPLTAAFSLHATPAQMGYLTAAGYAPNLLFGLIAGAWVDHLPKKPIMVVTDVLRAALLMVVPVLALTGHLTVAGLLVIAFLVGINTLLFDLAAQAFIPTVIGRERLLDGNSMLEASRSAATAAGPSLAGGLTQWLSAPLAISVNALTFIVSALFLTGLNRPEPSPAQRAPQIWKDIQAGLKHIQGSGALRASFRTGMFWNFFTNVIQAVLVLYATRQLHLSAVQLGLALSTMGAGMLLGSFLATRWRQHFGAGPALIFAGFLAASSGVFVALSGYLTGFTAVACFFLGEFIFGLGPMIFGINNVTLRQALTPLSMQGRIAATFRFVVWGALPLGALCGGLLGQRYGLQMALNVGSVGMIFAVILLVFSPLPSLKVLPKMTDE